MKDRRIYFVFVTLFFAALVDVYFWSHVLVGEGRVSDLGMAIAIGIAIVAVLAGLVARVMVRKKP